MSRILFAGGGTGGHLYPALALAAAVREQAPQTEVHFVGAQRGVEARVLPHEQQPHTLLPFEPLRRSRIWENWKLLPSFTRSALGLARLFREFKPRLVVGTGGYASAPACAWALLRGVPVALQEQNSWPGLTTRGLARWARQVHLGFPEAARRIKAGNRTEITTLGNPIRPPSPAIQRAAARSTFALHPDSVVVLVVGGSQGSRAINEALLDGLVGRVGEWASGRVAPTAHSRARPFAQILWATGPAHYESLAARVPGSLAETVKLVPYIHDMPQALAAADLAISRAGAMATAELLAWGVPALLIPLPTAAADHQTHNARALADAGAAVMLAENELSGDRLITELRRLLEDPALRERMSAAARARARPHAAREIAARLLALVAA